VNSPRSVGLSVASVTGIDVSLAVAGPGARAFAFLVDWHIRLILGLAWFVAAALIYNGSNGRLSLAPPLTNDALWFGAVVAPALAIYVLYHYAVELAMRGSTPGKRMAGVRIVARDGGAPGAGALLVRNVFRLIDSLPAFYGVGLIAAITTREHVRIGDMAAGTLLVYEGTDHGVPAAVSLAGSAGRLDARGAELIGELLERWLTLAPTARIQLARQLLARYGADAGGASAAADDATLHTQLVRLTAPPPQPAE
jgi:uncharacterized RDD family membrane protein YckC